MAQDRPSADNLIDTVRAFLETLLPDLEGDARFRTRVSIHLLGIVARELRDAPGYDREEAERLGALLGGAGDLAALNERLSAAIRRGDFDARWDEVMDHVRKTVEDKVRIVRPERLATRD